MDYAQGSLGLKLAIVLASTRMRLINVSRYPGQLVLDIIIPIVFASMPILLGRATSGANAGVIFAQNTGTSNYVAYMLIGSSVFTIVSYAFWHIAYWLRWEQETGTLEALYLSPTDRICLAFLFVLSGLVPLYGLTLLFGAVVLKVKEANALINLMQWGVSFLMGVFFPIAVFPPLLRTLALLFPPTWMTNGVRSALLGVGYFFQEWYLDLAVLWAFLLVAPLFGYWVFAKVETSVRSNEGVGQF